MKIPKESPEGRLIHRLGAAAGACARARTELALLTTHPEVRASDGMFTAWRGTRATPFARSRARSEDSMLDEAKRAMILRLVREGQPRRAVAQAMGVSLSSVKRVLRSGEDKLPSSTRSEPLAAQLDRIRALAQECKATSCACTRSWRARA